MADLDAASLADVKQWFRDHYGPNNAVLVIAGDIDRRRRPGRWSRNISATSRAGRSTTRRMADVPTLASAQVDRDEGPVSRPPSSSATGRCPGCSTDSSPRSTSAARCSAGSPARGSTRSWSATRRSRSASAPGLQPLQRVGIFEVSAAVKPGVDPALVAKRLDEIMADYLAKGPTADEVQRAVMSEVVGPDPRARAGRRLRRQGGRRSPKGRPTPTTATSTRRRWRPMRRSRRRRCARRCSSG